MLHSIPTLICKNNRVTDSKHNKTLAAMLNFGSGYSTNT